MVKLIYIVIRNIVLGFNLASLSFLLKPKKMIDYIQSILFLYKIHSKKRGLPQRTVADVLGHNTEQITLTNLKKSARYYDTFFLADIISLCLICRIMNPKVVFEIGTFRGDTARHFAENTGNDAKIYTLDLPPTTEANLNTTYLDKKHIEYTKPIFTYPKVTTLFGDSATFDFSPWYGKVDVFLIDGSHSHEYVKSDTENALRCCHRGSVIAWHDFGRMGVNGVSKYLLELSEIYEIYSIPQGSLAFMVIK